MKFLPASVVPLDMDELSDSVVSGRFNAGSSVVWDAAAGVPDGLKGRKWRWSCKVAGSSACKVKSNERPCANKQKNKTDVVFECGRFGGEGHVLYVVFGGSGALVELVSVVELILAGGVGEVWHRVWGDGNVGRGGDAAAGAGGPAPCRRERQSVSVVLLLYLKKKKKLLQGFTQTGIPFLSVKVKGTWCIFNTFSASAAERIDGTCSPPQ